MKVILVNGSPHKEGCTYTALKEIEKELINSGIETEIFWLGVKPLSGCLGCAQCLKKGPNGEPATLRCFMKDAVNEFLDKAPQSYGSKSYKSVLFNGQPLPVEPSEVRKGLLLAFPEEEIRFNPAIGPEHQNDFYIL